MFGTPEALTEEEKGQLHFEQRQEAFDQAFLDQFNTRMWMQHRRIKRVLRGLLGPGNRWKVSKMMRRYA